MSIFVANAFGIISKKSLPKSISGSFSPVFSSWSFTVSGLKFKAYFIWVDFCVWYKGSINYYESRYPFFQICFWRDYFTMCMWPWHHCQNSFYHIGEILVLYAKSLCHVQLCDPMDYSLPGSSAQHILQARILEWVAISCSRGSSWPRDQTQVSYVFCIGRRVLYHERHLRSLKIYLQVPDCVSLVYMSIFMP